MRIPRRVMHGGALSMVFETVGHRQPQGGCKTSRRTFKKRKRASHTSKAESRNCRYRAPAPDVNLSCILPAAACGQLSQTPGVTVGTSYSRAGPEGTHNARARAHAARRAWRYERAASFGECHNLGSSRQRCTPQQQVPAASSRCRAARVARRRRPSTRCFPQ